MTDLNIIPHRWPGKCLSIGPEERTGVSVGLDRGVAVFAAPSDGTKIKPLNAFKAIQDRLAKARCKLARKSKFSANWKKQKAKISRLHMRAANARKDFLHSSRLISPRATA
jgi:putative transposase